MNVWSAQPDDVLPLSMRVEDAFYLKGRGTVVVGVLAGEGLLSLGYFAECDGQSWRVDGIQQSGSPVVSVAAGPTVGVLMKRGPEADVVRHKVMQFTPPPDPGSGRGAGLLRRKLVRRQS